MFQKAPYIGFFLTWYAGGALLLAWATPQKTGDPRPVTAHYSALNSTRRMLPRRRIAPRDAGELVVGDSPRRFRRLFHVRATAYMPRPSEGGRYTYTQRDGKAAHGIAVDPHIIPLGTRLWIPGYGQALADDTGGLIQGHRIDVRVQQHNQLAAWGVRDLRVYVLAEPGR